MKRRPEKLELVCHTRPKAMLKLDAEPRLFSISMEVVVVSQAEAEAESD